MVEASSRMWLALPVWAGPELTCKIVTFDHYCGHVLFLPCDHQDCQRFVARVAFHETPQWDINGDVFAGSPNPPCGLVAMPICRYWHPLAAHCLRFCLRAPLNGCGFSSDFWALRLR